MRIILFFLLSFCFLAVHADSVELASDRFVFLQAKLALDKHNSVQFQLFSNELRNYPLYPYLRYWDLTQRLDFISDQEITDFLKTYSDTPLADRLRIAWLAQLAKQQRWPLFLRYYQASDDKALQCWNVQALLNTGQQQTALHLIPSLWLSGATLPENCNSLLFAWAKAGDLTNKLVEQRMALAINSNNKALIKNLLPMLSGTQQAYVQLQLLAKKDPQQAITQNISGFNTEQQQIIIRTIAIALARKHDPSAITWLNRVDAAHSDQTVREWRVRMAMLQNNWPQVSYAISQLSQDQRTLPSWQYWQAYALSQQNKSAAAREIYQSLINKISFYGLLASQQLGINYRPQNNAVVPSQVDLNAVLQMPAVQRARELYYVSLMPEARREWNWALDRMTPAQLRAAAYLANTWNWHDRAIVTAGKVSDISDLNLRFPFAYAQQIHNAAKRFDLNPAWVFAITRQESSFMPDSKSDVGAVGLMQLMPQTAKLLFSSVNLKLKPKTDQELLNTTLNIQLGSVFLKQLANSFQGNLIVATAAYNAGPNAVKKYSGEYKQLSAPIWIETLPWRETREYVKSVLLGMAIYQQRLPS